MSKKVINMFVFLPVFLKKFPCDNPPGYVEATISQVETPNIVPPTAPAVIPIPVSLVQDMAKLIGITAEPINTPIPRYTQPKLI